MSHIKLSKHMTINPSADWTLPAARARINVHVFQEDGLVNVRLTTQVSRGETASSPTSPKRVSQSTQVEWKSVNWTDAWAAPPSASSRNEPGTGKNPHPVSHPCLSISHAFVHASILELALTEEVRAIKQIAPIAPKTRRCPHLPRFQTSFAIEGSAPLKEVDANATHP